MRSPTTCITARSSSSKNAGDSEPVCSTPINVPAAINGTAAIERRPRLRMIGLVTVDAVTSSRIVGRPCRGHPAGEAGPDRESEALQHLVLEPDRGERHQLRPRRVGDEHGGGVRGEHVPEPLEEGAHEIVGRSSVQVDRRDGGQSTLELVARRHVGHGRQPIPWADPHDERSTSGATGRVRDRRGCTRGPTRSATRAPHHVVARFAPAGTDAAGSVRPWVGWTARSR